jgi:hypothetical protein
MKEFMEKPIQVEGGNHENPYAIYLRAIEHGETHFAKTAEYVSSIIRDLQSSEELPSHVMSEADWKNLVMTFIQALDRQTCLNNDDEKRAWILRSVRAIYDATPSGGNRIAPFDRQKK